VSREAVRAQFVNYLNGANIAGLGSVKTFPAKFTPEGEFYANEDPGHQSGAIVYPYIESQRERRLELTGPTGGGKEITYEVVFTCIFRSTKRKTEDAGADAESFLDGFTNAIRASKNCGGSGPILQWGEGSVSGGEDIEVVSYYPKQINGSAAVTQVVSTVRVSIIEVTPSNSYIS
jgi:hypothetical protein